MYTHIISFYQKELSYWEGVYGRRTYCNFTFIAEDASATAAVAGRTAYDKWLPFYTTHILPVYNAHLKDHVDALRPTLRPVASQIQEWMDGMKMVVSRGFRSTAKSVKAHCPQIKSQLKALAKQRNTTIPNLITATINETCREPEKYLTSALWFWGIVLFLFCRGFIWRTLMFPFRVLAALPRMAAGAQKKAKADPTNKAVPPPTKKI